MILVTVGTQKFEFNRLLEEIDRLVENGVIQDEIFAQTGVCSYQPKHYAYRTFIPKDVMQEKILAADIVITHAGTGMIMNALRLGKKVIAVPRRAKYHEHVDDHQLEIVGALGSAGTIEGIEDVSELGEAYQRALTKTYKPYVSSRKEVVAQIDRWIAELRAGRK